MKDAVLHIDYTKKGFELYEHYTTARDFTGSRNDEYAQLLQTIYSHIGHDIFDLLEQAEIENKRLTIVDNNKDEYTKSDIVLA